ncbi:hypothetical protein KBZ00_33390 [Streptomyces sp. RK31]|uniref:Uncharacterized protein n=1 Tax=Streptomyces zinciresistens K42 TaxID=700597 RepID=G2G9Z6_9ACTN|nr:MULTISPECIES: hypothetical protein [Streptomyces]EGX59707.1 hypothetical protein SZN_11583 [Streptomyces zinciresistens K42]MBQ0975964.1 hypothetical protein [Streptomyces sp. RK31]
MQITMPCGLGIGPGGQCSAAMCFNAATHVLEHHTDSGVWRAGAYCTPCLNRKVRPAAQVATADELDIMYGRTGRMNGLPDDTWKIRAFAPDELAELEAIRSGALLSLYVGPGNFIWATQADIEADRERRTAEEEAAKQVRRSRSRL